MTPDLFTNFNGIPKGVETEFYQHDQNWSNRMILGDRLIELDPRYVDVTIKRWQNITGRTAVNADTGTPYPDNGSQPVRAASLTIDAETRSDNGAIS
jgi:hypothetical protein